MLLHTLWLRTIDGCKESNMDRMTLRSKGFTLIASLLILVLLSAMSIGLFMMVNTEQKVSSGDLGNTVAFHAAETGIEQMTTDLPTMFQSLQSPTPANICALSGTSYRPSIPGITFMQYSIVPAAGCSVTTLSTEYGLVQSGPSAGLYAQLVPITLTASAALTGINQEEVAMTRNVQIALIPVFQFGVYSDSDLGFFASPDLTFAGRVHTNGDLYLGVGNSNTLTFRDKLSAYGNVVRQQLPNGLATSSYNNGGPVYVPTASSSSACSTTTNSCRALGLTEGSVIAGPSTACSNQTSGWQTLSTTTYHNMLIDGDWAGLPVSCNKGTGAKRLSLPFVTGTNFPYEIIRRPPNAEAPASALGGSRLYNQAQIRIQLSDDPNDIPNSGDGQTIRLSNGPNTNGPDYTNGVPTGPTVSGHLYSVYFAEGSTATQDVSSQLANNCISNSTLAGLPSDWPKPPAAAPAGVVTLTPNTAPALTASTWNLLDGYLRVEYKDATGGWQPVTREWLELGFARDTTPPTSVGGNTVNPNAILILQERADRNGDGNVQLAYGGSCSGSTPKQRPGELTPDPTTGTLNYGDWFVANSPTRNNWYPINFYDAREGEPRDKKQNAANYNTVTTNGVMNAVELDVGNLKRWLAGTIGTSGTNVDYQVQNGYILYFSDRRGMLPNPNAWGIHVAGTKSGDSGLEDSINYRNAAGTPDGIDPVPAGKSLSPEDVNQNGVLDSFGAANLGLGFYNGATSLNASITSSSPDNPYSPRIASGITTARKNWVSGARHVLRLVDGKFGNLPVRPDTGTCPIANGGFTIGSENPVYIWGNYNSDPTSWSAGTTGSSAGIVADAVTILSNSWSDLNSFKSPTDPGHSVGTPGRTASNTYYRVAIAAGKSITFPFPNSWENNTNYYTGTDGGVHNFLRYLEDWGGVNLYYDGSLVSLYYSTYATGMMKCCTYAVYEPPSRNFMFDANFATPCGLPPGTPMFRDVDSLSYRQILTSRSSSD